MPEGIKMFGQINEQISLEYNPCIFNCAILFINIQLIVLGCHVDPDPIAPKLFAMQSSGYSSTCKFSSLQLPHLKYRSENEFHTTENFIGASEFM